MKIDTPHPDQSFGGQEEIYVSGWTAANEPLSDVVVEILNTCCHAKTGIRRPDLSSAYPGVPALEHAGFEVTIPPPMKAANGPQPVELVVTTSTVSGLSTSEIIPLVITASPVPVSAQEAGRDELMKLVIDQAIVTSRGILKVVGWCACLGRLQAVTIALDDDVIGQAELELERKDVADAWPVYDNSLNSGFKLLADVTAYAGKRTLVVRGQALSGISREIRRPLAISAPSVARSAGEVHRLECDKAILSTSGDLVLKGWAASSGDIQHIVVRIDDDELGHLERGFDRPDVGNQFPHLAQARQSGFAFSARVAPECLKKEHIIRFEMVLADGSIQYFKHAVAPQAVELVPSGSDANQRAAEIMLYLDVPAVVDGKAVKEVTNALPLSGWALARDGIDRIEILMDDHVVGRASCGMRRKDVAQAFPTWDGALESGFGLWLPRRFLKTGEHQVRVTAFGKSWSRATVEFAIQVTAGDEHEGPSSLRTRLSEAERRLQAHLIARFDVQPWFEIGLRARGANTDGIIESIRSIAAGCYDQWCVALTCPMDQRNAITAEITKQLGLLGGRIVVRSKSQGGGPSKRPRGKPLWHLCLEAGDRLSVDALFEFAAAINQHVTADFVYGDDRRTPGRGEPVAAFFKPDWSPELLLSQNYIGRAFCLSDDLLRRCRLKRNEADIYDLVLQSTESARRIVHVKRVVCEHKKPTHSRRDQNSLRRAVKRRGLDVNVEEGLTPSTHRLRPRAIGKDLVSIIIPTCAAGGLIEKCLTSLRDMSTHRNIEIICVDNILDPDSRWKAWLRHHADIVVEITEPFNWSRFNNLAAAEASGSLLLFLNDDIEITQPDWLENLVAIACRDEIGVVGPQLLYPDGKVQHAGLFLSKPGLARHVFRSQAADDPGYFDLALSQRNVIAVSGACLMVRRSVFEKFGGFDEQHAVVNNDLDFCLKCHAAGLWNVYTPFARLTHHELASRALLKDDHHSGNFSRQWDNLFARGDPFFHPDLDHHSDGYEPEAEPVRIAIGGGPRYRAKSIRKILVVKVDHIGDFITAFPAFRRLKQKFPNASLHVLAAPASRQLGFLEPAIDEIIPFAFFHARSSDGLHDLGEEGLKKLRHQLAPYEFDLAVDFRKHGETRLLLQYAGAKITAGYDYQNQFPWLDVALQWEGDPAFVTKRHHISEDLINLVDAIVAAGSTSETIVSTQLIKRKTALMARLKREGGFARPIVCVHPAAGTELRQWPPAYFASLINLLVEAEDVNVAIVGGPDEVELGELVMKRVLPRDRVLSLIGQFKLDELAVFIANCALFVGNNSGPKHMAAALGVPTIAIESGIVDAAEWGPSGVVALAIRREVSCAPCYLAKREDCHRDVACLNGISPGVVLASCRRLLAVGRTIKVT